MTMTMTAETPARYGQRTGLGIRRSLEAMSQQATGGAR
jgi:hypothetical protein